MKVQCPICERINNVAGLYLTDRANDGKVMSSGIQPRQTINCMYCDTIFVPEPYKGNEDEQQSIR